MPRVHTLEEKVALSRGSAKTEHEALLNSGYKLIGFIPKNNSGNYDHCQRCLTISKVKNALILDGLEVFRPSEGEVYEFFLPTGVMAVYAQHGRRCNISPCTRNFTVKASHYIDGRYVDNRTHNFSP
jgi:hypothetical protein